MPVLIDASRELLKTISRLCTFFKKNINRETIENDEDNHEEEGKMIIRVSIEECKKTMRQKQTKMMVDVCEVLYDATHAILLIETKRIVIVVRIK